MRPFISFKELLPELGGVGHQPRLIGCFPLRDGCGYQASSRLGSRNIVLPVVGTQPGIFVHARDAVMRVGNGPFLRRRSG
jgi:hypothetical protein